MLLASADVVSELSVFLFAKFLDYLNSLLDKNDH
jgi:hypothetical protein